MLGVTGKFGLGVQNEAGWRLTEFCQENTLLIANTLFQQHEKSLHMDITRWSTSKADWLYYLQPKMLYTVSKNKTRSWLWIRSWTPYCQIQTETEESRGTTRPFGYYLNQIPYDYSGSEKYIYGTRSDRQSAWWIMDGGLWHCTGDRDQDHPRGKEMQKGKMVAWEGLTNSWEKKRS